MRLGCLRVPHASGSLHTLPRHRHLLFFLSLLLLEKEEEEKVLLFTGCWREGKDLAGTIRETPHSKRAAC